MILNIPFLIDTDAPADILLFFGRFHPLVVHLPIGFLLLAGLSEFALRWPKFKPVQPFVKYIWGLGVIGAILAVLFGYFLSLSGDYNEDTLLRHQWSGITLLLFSIIAYLISNKRLRISGFGKSIVVIFVLAVLFYTGHQGGILTHGATYLLEYAPNPVRQLAGMPKKAIPRKKVMVLDSADVYLDLVAPVIDRRCVSCHNNDKKKGDLDLTSYANLVLGGESGDVLIAGNSDASDLFRRITLPQDHDDFMPTEGKRPLTDDEVALIGWWIDKNAPSSGYFTSLNPEKEMIANVNRQLGLDSYSFLKKPVNAPKNEVLHTLISQGFILNKLMEDNYFLEANFSLSEKKFTAECMQSLLQLKEQLLWLNLSNSNISDSDLENMGEFQRLIKLNLSNNKISDKGLKHLENLQNLESLNIYNTQVSASLLQVIPKLKNLKRLYFSSTNATMDIALQLQESNENLIVVFD